MLLLRKLRAICYLIITLMIFGCSNLPTTAESGKSNYFDSAYKDYDKVPERLQPPKDAGMQVSTVDPVYMHTQADYFYSVGEAYSLEGQHQKAVESFKMVLVYDKDSTHIQLRLAAEYVKLGMVSQAMDHALIAVEMDPKNIEGHNLLGGLYSTLKSYDKAIEQYLTIMKIDPLNTDAPMYIGAVYAEQKQYDKAVKYFEALTRNDDYQTPHLAYYYVGRIRIEQEDKKYLRAAEQAFMKALQIKPDHVDSILALGLLFSRLGKQEKAMQLFGKFQREHGPNVKLAEVLSQKYLESEEYELAYEQLEILEAYSEDSLNIKVKMALILIEKKKFKTAITKLKEILQQAPESDKIRYYLSAVYEEVGMNQEAIDNFLLILPDSQFYGEAIVHATYLLKKENKLDVAIKAVKKGLEQRTDVAQIYIVYASLLDEKGDHQKALETLEAGAKKFPDHVQIAFYLGTIYDRVGQKNQVIENMKKVIEMDPNHVQGLNYLAFTYSELGRDLESAEVLVKRALEIEPHDGYILDTYGWILFKKGHNSEAIKVLENAFKAQPSESIIAEHLGDAYYKGQMVERAKTMYQKAVEIENDIKKADSIRTKITAIDGQEFKQTDVRRIPASAPALMEPLQGR